MPVKPGALEITPARTDRYTFDGDDAAEARIDADQKLIAQVVQEAVASPTLRGVVLMGGYGRGEGGFAIVDGQPVPYNDYDYFVVDCGLDRAEVNALSVKLAEVAHALEAKVGVEVDFYVLREEMLSASEYSLMNTEMLWGHRVITGDTSVLSSMPAMPFATLLVGEFTRLMTNRGALLLMNALALEENDGLAKPGEREQFVKYLFKATLACGDALLAAEDSYHPSYAVKQTLLEELIGYVLGIRFFGDAPR
jgi:hypothetical protein